MTNNANTSTTAPTTVTFREAFPAAKLGENKQQYNMRLAGYHARRDAFNRVARMNGWTITNP